MNEAVIRFGSIAALAQIGDLQREETEKIHDFQTRSRQVRYTRSINAKTREAALAEALRLFDKLDLPETTDVDFHCRRTAKSGVYLLEASWTVREL